MREATGATATGCSEAARDLGIVFRNPQSILCGDDRGPAVHPDDDLRHGLGRPLPAGSARRRLRESRSCARRPCLSGWIIGCPLLGWISDRIGRRKPVILGGAAVLLACLARGSCYGPTDVLAAVRARARGRASRPGAAMLPYTVIKEANPPRARRHRDRRDQFPELHVQRAARTGVRLDPAGGVGRRGRDAAESLPGRVRAVAAMESRLAIVLDVVAQGNWTGGAQSAAAVVEGSS